MVDLGKLHGSNPGIERLLRDLKAGEQLGSGVGEGDVHMVGRTAGSDCDKSVAAALGA
jgi:hypothetical protein